MAKCTALSQNIVIGEFAAIAQLEDNIRNGVHNAPLSEVTAIINLTTEVYKITTPNLPLYHYPVKDEQPCENAFEQYRSRYRLILAERLKPLLARGHCVLIVCDSGRRLAPFLAALAGIPYDQCVYGYMSPEEVSRYVKIAADILVQRYAAREQAEGAAGEAAPATPPTKVVPAEDLAYYESMNRDRLCLSMQYKRLYDYCQTMR